MTDMINIKALQQRLCQFDQERDWQQFHSLKNLAISVSCEVGELLELFQWRNQQQIISQAQSNPQFKQSISHEMADIIMYMVRICDQLGINLNQAIEEKCAINQQRYPQERVKGSAKKYSEY